jgi:hypothetical protein|tara:strand:+ start:105 stop:263 length:159 start_codon:yes stop_codon:yes gene_type:complete
MIKEAELDEDLLLSLVKGLEDVKDGRIKPWKKSIYHQLCHTLVRNNSLLFVI